MSTQPSAAVVTGAARGIGKATAKRFARDSSVDVVALLDVDDLVTNVAAGLEGAEGYVVDISDHDAVQSTITDIEASANIDMAVNNAVVNSPFHLRDLEPEEWDRIMNTNLKGYYNVARAVCIPMFERGHGRLVNISSGAGVRGSLSAGVHYSASKAGAIGLTKGLAKQLCPAVHVNCVVPGLIDTFDEKERDHGEMWTEEGFEKYLEMLPTGRLGEPEEVARVIHFLCGEGASYMTGSVVKVDGGGQLVPTREFLMGKK